MTRHPWISLVAALAVLLPLAAPTLTLILGQEDIGAWPTSTTQRRATDLISAGLGPGANGRLLVATRFSPPAQASAAYTAKKDRAERLARELERDAKRLKRQGKALERRAAALKADKAALEAQAAALKAQQAVLEAKAAPLLARRDALLAQKQQLLAQKARLQAQGAALAAQGAALEAQGKEVAAQIAAVQAQIAQTTDPAELQELYAQLAALVAQAQELQKQGAAVKAQAAALEKQAAPLAAKGRQLEQQGAALQAESAALTAQGQALQAQGARLTAEGAALKRRGAALEQDAAALKRERRRLERRADRARALKKDLVRMLTDAGGEPLATDPRLVHLQQVLASAQGVQSVSPPSVNKSGTAAVFALTATHAPGRPAHVGPGEPPAHQRDPRGHPRRGRHRLRGRHHRRLRRPRDHHLLAPAAGDRRRPRAQLHRAARRVPLGPGAAQGDPLQPAGGGRGVRHPDRVLPVGLGPGLIGLENAYGTVPIASYVPLIMFAVLFGMSTDYEVFLISQIFHAHAEGMDTHAAVRTGVGSSARVITAAAVIMVTVFASFVLTSDPIIKEFGIGLSIAILLDATIVRLVIVPATMVLLGEWNWWLPRWLQWLPRVDLPDERAGAQAPATRQVAEPTPAD